MEPSTKKRKLAPKVNPSPAPNAQPLATQYTTHEPSLSQSQHYAIPDLPHAERQDFESFARHLQDAAMLIQRQTERPPYADVSVLLLSWEEDRSVDEDLVALEHTLQDKYNYATQRWQIPTVPNPNTKLSMQMASFLENARPSHLLIIYYAGHGYLSADGHLYWACNAREDAAKLKWDNIAGLFEEAQSDILLLLDSCAIPNPSTASGHGIKQGIAAFATAHNHRDQEGRSFTANMIEALQRLHNGRPFSVNKLYEEIFMLSQKQLHRKPQSVQSGVKTPSSVHSHLPTFFKLTPGKGQCLILAPLLSRPAKSAQNGDGIGGGSDFGPENHLIDPESVSDLRFDETRILVCTTFVGDASPDMSFFNQWLQDTPSLGSRIAVEGMFLGPPTMLLISMPQAIWNVVQHDKVCCFLGYINSHNMIHLYEKLVGPGGVRPSPKQVEHGRILLEARELVAGTPARIHRDSEQHDHYHSSASRDHNLHSDRPNQLPQSSPSGPTFSRETQKSKVEVEDSAEMQEAAEQLKALSHVHHRSDEAARTGRARTSLPDAMSDAAREKVRRLSQGISDNAVNDSSMLVDIKRTPNSGAKGPRRSIMKQETRCGHCSHAPFKDSSSLRKHIAAAHTRPFPCAFSFAGCTSTFGSKNEWKRHIASQHLCLQYYRCSTCPQSAVEGRGNEFNRKDLFTQHLRRMHAPYQIKRSASQGDGQVHSEWETHVKEMQQSCLVTRRKPPQKAACPKHDCHGKFEGPTAWDDWTEHVGRHMEKGEGPVLGADSLLTKWAVDEGIIEAKGDGEYQLSATNGTISSQSSSGPTLDRKDSTQMSFTDSSQAEYTSMTKPKPAEGDVKTSQATATS
ncbi:hypothetical protein QQS21_005082 [Conoideocrella luteorostrata]|uniref:C2H2-type domain-containing protein n=1 Tax=Conoideocrella luteorostrata TaxID=1105319 RepID=A0AAJ0FU51_9HYPO|nr:hypothetical protein QQS21_005082 [Conoideocrella luteorostrata]